MALEEILKTACGQEAIKDPDLVNLLNKLDQEGFVGKKPAKPQSKVSKAWDVAFEAYVNSLLSSFHTQGINIVSNFVPLATRTMESLTAATLSPFIKGPDKVTFGAAMAEVGGLMEGFGDAIRFVSKRAQPKNLSKTNSALLEELDLPSALSAQAKIERQSTAITGENIDSAFWSTAIDWIGATVNMPGRLLTNSDIFFKTINYRAEVAKRAFMEAQDVANRQGNETVAMAAARIKQAAHSNADLDIVKKGLHDADVRTYTNKPKGSLDAWMATKGNEVKGLRWFVPFRRTLVNLIRYGADRSPLGLIEPIFKKSMTAAERQEAIARAAFGTFVGAYTANTLGDALDGEAPRNPVQRDLWEKNGHKPFTIRTGVKGPMSHIDLDALGSLGIYLKGHALYQQFMSNVDFDDDEEAKTAGQVTEMYMMAMASSLTNEHWLRNLGDAFGFLNEIRRAEDSQTVAKALMKFTSRYAAAFVPNIVKKSVTQNIDPNIKDIQDPWERVIAAIPVLSEKVMNKIDLWGDPMRYDHWLDPDITDPITGKDEVAEELRRMNVGIPRIRRKVSTKQDIKGLKSIELTKEQYQMLHILRGKGVMNNPPLRERLRSIMNMPLYKSFQNDEARAAMLKNVIYEYKDMALQYMLMHDEDLKAKYMKQAEQEANTFRRIR